MISIDALIPDTTYVSLYGLVEEMYLVTDVACHPDGRSHLIRLDKHCRYTVCDNFIALEWIEAVFEHEK